MISYRSNSLPEARSVAFEHLGWARSTEMTNAAVLASIGLPHPHQATDAAVIDALERTWLAMKFGYKVRPLAQPNQHTKRAAE